MEKILKVAPATAAFIKRKKKTKAYLIGNQPEQNVIGYSILEIGR